VALAGRNASTPVVRGTFSEGESYSHLNIVALNGSSFVARMDNPGACPGDGWQLIASAGKPGKPGPRGEQGPAGITKVVTISIKGWEIRRESYEAVPILADGSRGEPLDLHPFFEQYHGDRNG